MYLMNYDLTTKIRYTIVFHLLHTLQGHLIRFALVADVHIGQYSNYASGWMTEDLGFDPQQKDTEFVFVEAIRLALAQCFI